MEGARVTLALTQNPAILRGHREAAPVGGPQQPPQCPLQILLQGGHLPVQGREQGHQGRGWQKGACVLRVFQLGSGADMDQLLESALVFW